MADEQTLNHIMNEYEELRISAANERKKRIDEVNKKFREWLKLTERFFNAVWKILKEYLKIPIRLMNITGIFKKI